MSNDFLRELASSRPVYQEMQGLGMLRTGISEYKLQSKNLVHKGVDFNVRNTLKLTYEHL